MHSLTRTFIGCALTAPLLGSLAQAQPAANLSRTFGPGAPDPVAVPGCARPADAKEAKVIDFDAGSSVARLAVNLGPGRFKLVTVKVWDRPNDPRPLKPVIEAARITQGKLQFYTPDLNADPASAPETFLVMTDMGGGYVCWATPSQLMNENSYKVADGEKWDVVPVAGPAAKPVPNTATMTNTPGAAEAAVQSLPEQFVRTKRGRKASAGRRANSAL